MTALLDTGFVLALLDRDDKLHQSCRASLAEEPTPLLPSPVVPELAYLIIRNVGYVPLIAFLQAVVEAEPPVVFPEITDFARARDILEQYMDSRIDFVDCMVAAMAERLNITRVLTVDQRHFRLLRPRHTDAFEILP